MLPISPHCLSHLMCQHLPQVLNPLAPEHPLGCRMLIPHRQQLCAHSHHQSPRQRGEGAQAQHGGFWVQHWGQAEMGLRPEGNHKEKKKICPTLGCVVRESGCPPVSSKSQGRLLHTFPAPKVCSEISAMASPFGSLDTASLHSLLHPFSLMGRDPQRAG